VRFAKRKFSPRLKSLPFRRVVKNHALFGCAKRAFEVVLIKFFASFLVFFNSLSSKKASKRNRIRKSLVKTVKGISSYVG
jgi:hypothetical protein